MKSTRRAASRRRPPPFLGVPSVVPGGRPIRSIGLALAVGLTLVATFAFTWTPVVADHARGHPVECIDVPVALHAATHCGNGRGLRVLVAFPRREVDAPPVFVVKGKSYDEHDLRRYLRAMADMRREDEGGNAPSAVSVEIRADRSTPWSDIQRLMDACADPTVRIYRIRFAVRPPGSLPCAFAPPPVDDPITSQLKEQIR